MGAELHLRRWLRGIVTFEPGEVRAALLGWACFFCVLASYGALRPFREHIGVAGGPAVLFQLGCWTLVVMLIASLVLNWLVSTVSLQVIKAFTFRFFAGTLLLFLLFQRSPDLTSGTIVAKTFYIWLSVFNLFVVTIFWAVMVDAFRMEQGRRIFAFIALGGTLGAAAGAALTASLAHVLDWRGFFVIAVALLEVAARLLSRCPSTGDVKAAGATGHLERASPLVPDRGVWLDSLWSLARSPYLLGLALYMVLFNVGSAWLTYQQAGLVKTALPDSADRIAFLARLDLATYVLTIAGELLLTPVLLRRLGTPATLCLLPALSIAGFAALAVQPALMVLVVFHVLRRSGEFAVAKPARELLFTLVTPLQKYTAKPLIDTFCHRAGDVCGGGAVPHAAGSGLCGRRRQHPGSRVSRVARLVRRSGASAAGQAMRGVLGRLECPLVAGSVRLQGVRMSGWDAPTAHDSAAQSCPAVSGDPGIRPRRVHERVVWGGEGRAIRSEQNPCSMPGR